MGKLRYVGPGASVSTPQGEYEFKQGEWVDVEDDDLYQSLLQQDTFESKADSGDEGDEAKTKQAEDPLVALQKAARQTPRDKVEDKAHNTDGQADGA